MDLVTAVQGLLLSEKYSDITLKCDETVFKVHRAIICTRSPVLARALDGDFKEGVTGHVDLSAHELSVVNAMVTYLYTDDYDDNSSQFVATTDSEAQRAPWLLAPEPEPAKEYEPPEPDRDSDPSFEPESEPALEPEPAVDDPQPADTTHPSVFNTKVYIIADQYNIPGLKTLAKSKYERLVYHTSLPWGPSTLMPFIEATELLWENTVQSDRLLRDVVVDTAVKNIDTVSKEPAFISLMGKWGDLAVDILMSKLQKDRVTEYAVEDPWSFSSKKGR